MANHLNIDVTNKVVVVSKRYYRGDEWERRFLCKSGFGCNPSGGGNAIYGTFLTDGEEARIEGFQIEKLSDDQSTEAEKIK